MGRDEHRPAGRDEYRPRDEEPPRREDDRRGGGGGPAARKFERGDLRNSLRERRAAREVTLAKPVTGSFRYPRCRK